MKKIKTKILTVVCCSVLILSSCSMLSSKINDIKGSLIGNSYTINTYDNYGQKIFETNGEKVDITGNKIKTKSYDSDGSKITNYDMSSVITVTVDGKEIQSCGDTCIFVQKGLDAEVDFRQKEINSSSNDILDNTSISKYVNKYKNLFGKSRVVVIKSQLGQPIVAYSGDNVYWEIPDDLPKMTKLMIDGKAVYVHRANFQIIDKELLK